MATAALGNGGKEKDSPFYEGLIKSAEFYTQTMLPVTFGKMDAILGGSSAAIDIPEEAFGAK